MKHQSNNKLKELLPGYYYFDIRTGDFLDYRVDLGFLEEKIVGYIMPELVGNSPYDHIIDILQKKFGNLYLINSSPNEKKLSTINVIDLAKDIFKNLYTKHIVTEEFSLQREVISRYDLDSLIKYDFTDLKINDNRILCLMQEYVLKTEWKQWLKEHLEKYSLDKDSDSFILYNINDLNYLRLAIPEGYEPYSIIFSDLVQKLISYGFPKEAFK